MINDLDIGQLSMLVGLSLFALYYVLHFRIWSDWFPVCDVLFVAALAVVVASIAQPIVYERLSNALIDRSPLPSALATADERVLQIETMPGQLIRAALARVGYESEESAAAAPAEPGPFASTIRPSVEALLMGVLRAAGFVCGTLLLWTTLALRAIGTRRIRLGAIAARVAALERAAGPDLQVPVTAPQ
jgi:hypothetical protein